jgi:hypothetical protein
LTSKADRILIGFKHDAAVTWCDDRYHVRAKLAADIYKKPEQPDRQRSNKKERGYPL